MALQGIGPIGLGKDPVDPGEGTSRVDNPGGGKVQADFNTFVKLLTAQLKNQDPTKPMDSTQFVSQLASFSAVEQAMKTNEWLSMLLASNQVANAGGYIGKYVQYKDEDGNIITGRVKTVGIYSDGIVAKLDNGKEVVIGPSVSVSDEPFSANESGKDKALAVLTQSNPMLDLTPANQQNMPFDPVS
ncbi:flagellar hook assembly protein FlgD [Bartonella sp. DGB2]|uniref:flagellar hook assembly protein FlgD n=1 Tax=Bartonella sp. DGB2 TaxID=3388426 RepID=UPI00398FDEBF